MTALYRVSCKECGRVQEENVSDTFLDPFFLPKRCPKCHDYKSQRHRFCDGGWDIVYGEYYREEVLPTTPWIAKLIPLFRPVKWREIE